jgi:hypothetical protein
MRTILRLVALAIALGGLVLWLFGGPNLGWTKTSIDRIEKDPVTGLEGHFPEDRLLLGVDFLGGCLLVAGLLAGTSFLFRKREAGSDIDLRPSAGL